MIEVIPSLPALSFQELKTKTSMVKDVVSTFQIDVADGMFVPARSWPMNPGDKGQFQRIVKGEESLPFSDKLSYEVHFMAHNPEKLLPDWLRIGIVRVLFHVEARHDFSTLVSLTQKEGIELGATLKIGTPISRLDNYIDHISTVQLMGIKNIGTQGQPFDEKVIDMIRNIKQSYPGVIIEVDGSVNEETAPVLVEAGATRLAPGSYVFQSDDPKRAVETLKKYGSVLE